MSDNPKNLPAITGDNFGGNFKKTGGVPQYSAEQFLKYKDSEYSTGDGVPIPLGTALLAMGTNDFLQRWEDSRPVEHIIDAPLPDIDTLNAAIPKKLWRIGLNGEPDAPWKHVFLAYLIDPATASAYVFQNSTVGTRIAIERLRDRVMWMQRMKSSTSIVPLVKLDVRAMKTRFGVKKRPELTIVDWRDLAAPTAAVANNPTPQIGGPVAAPTSKEIFNDEIGI